MSTDAKGSSRLARWAAWILVLAAASAGVMAWSSSGNAPTRTHAATAPPQDPGEPQLLAPTPLPAVPAAERIEGKRVRVLDLGSVDEVPAVGMQLECVHADGTRASCNVAPDGRLPISIPEGARLFSADPAWRLASSAPEPSNGEHVLWAWRTIRVCARVVSYDGGRPLDPAALAVVYRFGGRAADGGDPGRDRWNFQWIASRGLPRETQLQHTSDGFRAVMPRVSGYGIRASAPGFLNAWTMLDTDTDADEIRVQLELRPCRVVRGTLRDAMGPLANAEVRAYIVRHTPHDEISGGHLLVQFGHGYSASWEEDLDAARVTTVQVVRSDRHGNFVLPLRARGQVWLVADAPSHTPFERTLGVLDRDVDDMDIELAFVRPAVAQVRNDGKLLASSRFTIADMSQPDLQVARTVQSNGRGEIRVEWMQRGRTYMFIHAARSRSGGRNYGFLVWTGQTEIDISRLAQREQ